MVAMVLFNIIQHALQTTMLWSFHLSNVLIQQCIKYIHIHNTTVFVAARGTGTVSQIVLLIP